MSRRSTRSSASNADLVSGLDAGPRDPPRGSGQRSGAKFVRRNLSNIQKLPIKFDMPEKGKVTVGYYTGNVARGKMHGTGTIEFLPICCWPPVDCDVGPPRPRVCWSSFKGTFCHGELDGTGTLKYVDGVVYKGESFPFLSGTSSNSAVKVAIHRQDDDDVVGFSGNCTGYFRDGAIHGTASVKYKYDDGSTIGFSNCTGFFRDDAIHGTDGCTHDGCWRHDVPHGKGVMIIPRVNDTLKYTGEFTDGLIHGAGSLEWIPKPGHEADHEVRSAGGTFVADRLTHGWIKYQNGTFFEGTFLECGPHFMYKHGKHHYAGEHNTYTGEFLDNERHGQGIEVWDKSGEETDLDVVISVGGTFEDDQLIEGWVKFRHGDRFEGSFCDDELGLPFKHGKYQWNRGRCTYTGGFLNGDFHGAGVLHNTHFLKNQHYDCWKVWEDYDPECFSMMLVQPSGVSIHLGLTYEGDFENGMRHGRGTLTLRPFTPTPATENFSPITIYEGEWQHGLMHGRGKYCCLPLYESLSDVPETENCLLTRGTVTRKWHEYGMAGTTTRQWHNFEGAMVKGGILECNFEKGMAGGQGKCTFYGSECKPGNFGIKQIVSKRSDYNPFVHKTHVVSLEGEIKWSFGCPFLHRLTWADEKDTFSHPVCESGWYTLTLANGDKWEGKLVGMNCSGPWTCTDKNGFEAVTQFMERED